MPYRGADNVVWLEESACPVSSEIGARPQTSDDSLIGVMSRHRFEYLAHRDLAQARQARGCLSCAIIEIDELCSITESYGQRVSDCLPGRVASICSSLLCRAAYIAHFGENKIAVMLPRTSLMNAFAVAESIRAKVAAAIFDVGGERLRLSVSIGVAELNFPEHCLDGLLGDIASLLLKAKLDGKSQVACHFGDLRIRSNHFPEDSVPPMTADAC